YYVSAKPHIGYGYTTVAADALGRFRRLMNDDVFFLTGTDEHGQKVEKASRDAGLSPQEFTDRLSGEFRSLWETLGIGYDDFIRTTEERHREAVRSVWVELERAGLIRREKYEGWYCTPCETFWPERELEGQPVDARVCPQCRRPLEEIHEDNFFFAISRHRGWLISHIRRNPDFILPESRRNETLAFLEQNELNDLCISRPKARLQWGIESPLSSDHVTYVWFDALINYISALGYPDRTSERFRKYWPASVHLIGKDILRPHTVYWPIMLHALGLEPPRCVFAHGWWMVDETKMSKSLGNVVNPVDVVKEYGVDAFRYFLLREVPFGQDGTYSDEAITLRYNVDLANDLGNLLHRTLSMLDKYFGGVIKARSAENADNPLRSAVKDLPTRMEAAMNRLQFSEALHELWQAVSAANKFIDASAPWALHREGQTDKLAEVMVSVCEVLRIAAQAVWPFMPASAGKIYRQLGLDSENIPDGSFTGCAWNYFVEDTQTRKDAPVFPRRDKITKGL
ncbi:MAG: methionine--tRNA ligase, partial [Candidatus Omnitrophica bacterium]|nr:methionine--tRNA ligase [Candidatus Omnitrophota bacterium]